MGKNQSKDLSSLGSSFEMPPGGQRAKADTASPVLFHSNSLDSISTALSFGTELRPLLHSNSMDSLLHRTGARKKGGQALQGKRKGGGKAHYDELMESSSVITALSDFKEDLASSNFEGNCRTRLDSTSLETSARRHRSSSDVTEIVRKHPSSCGKPEPETKSTSSTADHPDGQQSIALTDPRLHPSIVEKLTHEEWQELITYACTTLGQTLLASVLPKAPNTVSKVKSPSIPSNSEKKGEGSCNYEPSGCFGSEACVEDIESMITQLKSHKLERTTSFPPHLHGDKSLSRSDSSCHYHSHSHGHCQSNPNFNPKGLPQPALMREDATTKALECRDIIADSTRLRSRRERRNCQCSSCENKHSRRKKGRGRSESVRDHTASLVDTSLDDDCPGVPENRIRRPRHHYHHHHHHQQYYVCKQCVEESLDARSGKRGKRGWCKHNSPNQDHGCSGTDSSPPPSAGGGGPSVVMTLEDVRTATLLLEKATEFVNGHESAGEDEQEAGGGGSEKVDPYARIKAESHSTVLEAENKFEVADNYKPLNQVKDAKLGNGWQNIPSHSAVRRSGRDSPATDMAVVCLDLNSAKMLKPLPGYIESAELGDSAYRDDVRHLHNHHHVIHHSQLH